MSSWQRVEPETRRGLRGRRWLAAWAVVPLVALGVQIPQAGAANEVHLVAAGDFGARSATNTVLTEIADLSPDAALALGDLAYRDAVPESAWCSYVKERVGEGFPFQLISGNHESLDVADGAINNYSACLPNQIPGIVGTYGREYYMDMPQGSPLVRVINTSPRLTFEDGRWTYTAGDDHYEWLSEAIDDGREQGARWIVVTAHVPCLSVGSYNCPSNRDFYELLLSKKVDLVLHGHEHAYMRTHQLATGVQGCTNLSVGTFDEDCVADSDDSFAQGQGTVFATVGTGGTPLRNIDVNDSEAAYFASVSGLNEDPTYGLLDVHATDTELSAAFASTSGAGIDDSFTIGPPPANQPPAADFTTAIDELSVTVDATNSTDADGTIDTYAWDYGDDTTATGATPPAHTYAQAGSYTIELTVTDNNGDTDQTTKNVDVTTNPPVSTLAQDTFERSVATGWGEAEIGGPWTNRSNTSVSEGVGKISNTAGSGRSVYLREVSSTETDLQLAVSTDKATAGSGLYFNVAGRAVPNVGDYRAKLRIRSDGHVYLYLTRVTSSHAETTLSAVRVPNVTHEPDEAIQLRLVVTGTGPTTVKARAWAEGDPEPTGWLLSTNDATPAFQAPGGIGLNTYYSSSATNSPVVASVDDLLAVVP